MLEGTCRVRELLRNATPQLGDRFEAEELLCHALERDRAWLMAHATDAVAPAARARFDALLARRVAGEPVAYITGLRGFWKMDLQVSPAVLIPRPETELLVEQVLARVPTDRAGELADLGTGSGAVALALGMEYPRAAVLATDASAAALSVAQVNAERQQIANVQFVPGDWFAPLAGRRFDAIVSNPPYVADGDAHLAQGDLRYEPATALAAGADGLDAIRRIVADAPGHLKPGAWLVLEHGYDQAEHVRQLLGAAGFAEVFSARDLQGHERVSGGRVV